jgi:hypothetical protein
MTRARILTVKPTRSAKVAALRDFERISAGGMGEVWRAADPRLEQ